MRSNLNFRPPSYWDHPDPLSAILSNIKGQNRRQMIAAVVTGRAPAIRPAPCLPMPGSTIRLASVAPM